MEFTQENFGKLVAFVQQVAGQHNTCEDCWYSCPMSKDCCNIVQEFNGCNCWCGEARELLGIKDE